jgi:hypothetical protein
MRTKLKQKPKQVLEIYYEKGTIADREIPNVPITKSRRTFNYEKTK